MCAPSAACLSTWCRPRSFFFFQAEDGIRDKLVTGVQTCALPICRLAQHRADLVLEEHELTEDEIRTVLRKATIAGHIVPVLCGAAFKNKGVQALLEIGRASCRERV